MIPTDGLISTFAGQMVIVLVLTIIGVVVCLVLTGLILIRKGPELTTQRDMMTGKKEYGLITWFLFFASFTIAPPLLFGIVRTLIEAVDVMDTVMPYWWIIFGLVGVCVLCVVVYRKYGKRLDRAYEPPEPVFEDKGEADLPVQPWGLPEGMPQWSDPR